MECDVTDPTQGNTILILEPKSLRPFKSRDEYLFAMKEDLAEWFYCLYQIDINVNNFFERLETGVTMCKHANSVQKFTKDAMHNGNKASMDFLRIYNIPIEYDIPFFAFAKPRTFQARDNISNFICWCRSALRIPQVLLFETDDLVLRKNERSVVLCLLEMARVGARLGMLAPTIVQMEAEIDAEIEGRADPPPQIKTCDLRSLDEMVRDLVGECSCPSQFPVVKVCEGKYKVGVSESLIFVRILRKHVMVRVGGGWDTLEHYLDKHDPCRCHYMGHRNKRSTTPGLPEKRNPAKSSRSQSVCSTPIDGKLEPNRTVNGQRANINTDATMESYKKRYDITRDAFLKERNSEIVQSASTSPSARVTSSVDNQSKAPNASNANHSKMAFSNSDKDGCKNGSTDSHPGTFKSHLKTKASDVENDTESGRGSHKSPQKIDKFGPEEDAQPSGNVLNEVKNNDGRSDYDELYEHLLKTQDEIENDFESLTTARKFNASGTNNATVSGQTEQGTDISREHLTSSVSPVKPDQQVVDFGRRILCCKRLPFGIKKIPKIQVFNASETTVDSNIGNDGLADPCDSKVVLSDPADEQCPGINVSNMGEGRKSPPPPTEMDAAGQLNMDEISTMSLAQFKSLLNSALAVPGNTDNDKIVSIMSNTDSKSSGDSEKTMKRQPAQVNSQLKPKNGYVVPRARSTPPANTSESEESLNITEKPRRTLPQSPPHTNSDIACNSANTNTGRSKSRPASARAVMPGTPVQPANARTSIPRPVSPARLGTPTGIPRPVSARTRALSVDRYSREGSQETGSNSGSDISVHTRGRSPAPSSPGSTTPARQQSRPSSPGPRKLVDHNKHAVLNSPNKKINVPNVRSENELPSQYTKNSARNNSVNKPFSSEENKLNGLKVREPSNSVPRKQSIGTASKIIASKKMYAGSTEGAGYTKGVSKNNETNRGRSETRDVAHQPRPKSAGPRLLPKPNAREESIIVTRTGTGQHKIQLDEPSLGQSKSPQILRSSTGVTDGQSRRTSISDRQSPRQLPQKPVDRPQSTRPRTISRENSIDDSPRGRRPSRPGSGRDSERQQRASSVDKSDGKTTLRCQSTNIPGKIIASSSDRMNTQRRKLPTNSRRSMTPNSLERDKESEYSSRSVAGNKLSVQAKVSTCDEDSRREDEKMYRRMEYLFEKYRQKELKESVRASYDNREAIMEKSEDSESAYTAEDETSLKSDSIMKSDDEDIESKQAESQNTFIISNVDSSISHQNCDRSSQVTSVLNSKDKTNSHLIISSRERSSSTTDTSEDDTLGDSKTFIDRVKHFNKQMNSLPSSKTPTNDSLESGLDFDSCGECHASYTDNNVREYSGVGMERQDSCASLSDASQSSSTSGCRSETPVPKLPKPLTTGRSKLLVKKDPNVATGSHGLISRSVSMDSNTDCVPASLNGHCQSSSSSIDEDGEY